MSELYAAAALADLIYARDPKDQAVTIAEINNQTGVNLNAVPVVLGSTAEFPPGLHRSGNGFYYSPRGFVGAVFTDGTKYYVVLRGTDMGNAGLSEIINAVQTGQGSSQIDGKDWQQNSSMGGGLYYGTSQADDAIALTQAVLGIEGVDIEDVVVTGQSLGGGLSGLVTAYFGVKGYALAPAPFAKHIHVLAVKAAAEVVEADLSIDIQEQHLRWAFTEPRYNNLGERIEGLGDSIDFQWEYGLDAYNQLIAATAANKATFKDNVETLLEVHTIEGETLSSDGVGNLLRVVADHFTVENETPYDLGSARSTLLHGPSGHMLAVRTEDFEGTFKFSELMQSDDLLRAAFFNVPIEEFEFPFGIVGTIDHARVDTANTTSKMGQTGPNATIAIRALWKDVGSNGALNGEGLYAYFCRLFGERAQSGEAAQGLNDSLYDLSLHNGIVKLALGVLRSIVQDTSNIAEVKAKLDDTVNFAGGSEEGQPFEDKIVIDKRLITQGNAAYMEKMPIGSHRMFGQWDIDHSIWSRAQLETSTAVANQLLGFTDDQIEQGRLELNWKVVVAQAGSDDGPMSYDPENDSRKGQNFGGLSHAIFGGDGNDTVKASTDKDYIFGGGGDDTIDGGDGADLIFGGVGDDTLKGGSGKDTILGGVGDDTIEAGDSGDILWGNAGADDLDGGSGEDIVVVEGADTVAAGTSDDRLYYRSYDASAPEKYLLIGGQRLVEGNTIQDLKSSPIKFVGRYGETYTVVENGSTDELHIKFKSSDDEVIIENWVEGDYGISLVTNEIPIVEQFFQFVGGALQVAFTAIGNIFKAKSDPLFQMYSTYAFTWQDLKNLSGNQTLAPYDPSLRGTESADEMHGATGDDRMFGNGGNDTISASSGKDTLHGGFGIDLLDGGEGNDSLDGGDGNDRLIGGLGSDTITSGTGADTIVFSRGDGKDVVKADAGDVIEFDATISSDDVTIGVSETAALPEYGDAAAGGLVLGIKGTDDSVTILGGTFDHVSFADGTVWSAADIYLKALSKGATSGSDIIAGSDAAEVLAGAAGNDYLNGGGGSDRYIFNVGDGVDKIEDREPVRIRNGYFDLVDYVEELPTDELVLGPGILPEDISITVTYIASGSRKNEPVMHLHVAGSADQVEFPLNDIDRVVFSNGAVWNSQQLRALFRSAAATSGDDTFFQDRISSETIAGSAGNDVVDRGLGLR